MSCLPSSIFSKDLAGVKSFLQSLSLQFSKHVVSFRDFGLSTFQLMSGLTWGFVCELNLSKNGIISVSESVLSCLNHLQMIDLSDNPIHAFPPIWRCSSITHVFLHHCQISEIPSNVRQLLSLEFLDLSWCRLSEIVDHVALMSSLKKIVLSGNMYGGFVTLNFPISCTHVDLSGAGLSSLKFQSEAKRLQQEQANESVVRRFGKKLLQKTHEKTRFVQGHIYRDEHLSEAEILRVNEAKVHSLRLKLGLATDRNQMQTSISASTPDAAAEFPLKSNMLAGIRFMSRFH